MDIPTALYTSVKLEQHVMLFIDMQKLITNPRKIMIKINNLLYLNYCHLNDLY